VKRLLLLRHAKAVPSAASDHARELSRRGLRDAVAVGQAIVRQGWRPDVALVSDARRTRETFEGLALGKGTVLRLERTLYDATPETILKTIAQAGSEAGTLLVVGHNPGIALTANKLAATGPAEDLERLRSRFPTASLAVIGFDVPSWTAIREAEGRLQALLWTHTGEA
jgi:phosphohistidine phosphatase